MKILECFVVSFKLVASNDDPARCVAHFTFLKPPTKADIAYALNKDFACPEDMQRLPVQGTFQEWAAAIALFEDEGDETPVWDGIQQWGRYRSLYTVEMDAHSLFDNT